MSDINNINAVEKNKYYTLEILDLGKNGEGIGKIDGFAVFAEHTLPGDIAEIKIVKAAKNHAYGKLINIVKPSPNRIEPLCVNAKRCGGCTLQHLSYAAELRQKQKIVSDALERIGGFKDVQDCMRDIIGMDSENPSHYRNKAQFPVCKNPQSGVIDIGFFAQRSHTVIDSERCPVSHPINGEIIKICKNFMNQNNIKPYDEIIHSGLVRHIFTRVGFFTGEIMVCIVINGESLPNAAKLIDELKKIDGMTSIVLNINREKSNVILGRKIISLWGKGYIYDYIDDLKFRISPLSFYQVNPSQMKVLYQRALEMSGISDAKNAVCIDAYCGIGTISLYFARYAKKVYGIEIIPEAVYDAAENARINGISEDRAEFTAGKAEDEIAKLMQKNNEQPNLVIVDPPRKGCDIKLLDAVIHEKIEKILYISCDPATLARDARHLCENGYGIEEVQPVDMFPHTMHIECVVLITRVEK